MAAATGETPPALAARPELSLWLGSAMAAFGLLNGSRGAGYGGPLPIPLSEIESYCRLYGWTRAEEVDELVEIVRAMDEAYLAVAARHGGSSDPREDAKADKRSRHRGFGSPE